jgi:peroxiredoxin Q/BCP
MPNIGDVAPDFELPNQDGQPVKLSQYRGRKVILFAYPKAGTEGCTKQACGFRDQFPHFTTHNAVILGISPDEPKAQRKWKEKENLPYDLGAWGEKKMYGKSYMGVIRSHWVIDENGVILDAQIGISPKDSVEKAARLLG